MASKQLISISTKSYSVDPHDQLSRGPEGTGMILKRGVLLCLVTAPAIGCSSALLQGVAQGLAASSPASAGVKLMVFGGPGHKTYLGCLSCSSYSSESLFNSYGTYGSEYSGTSILNAYSEYGSLCGGYSACNPYASDPPVIVDGSGRYYGRFTVSSSRSDGPPAAARVIRSDPMRRSFFHSLSMAVLLSSAAARQPRHG